MTRENVGASRSIVRKNKPLEPFAICDTLQTKLTSEKTKNWTTGYVYLVGLTIVIFFYFVLIRMAAHK